LTLDRERLAGFLLGRTLRDRSRTFYRQILRSPSASVTHLTVDGVRETTPIPFAKVQPRDASVAELVTELRERVASAVSRAMAGAKSIAVSTSGGLDSSYVLATALAIARRDGQPQVPALNLRFAGAGDDRRHFDTLCASLGVTPVTCEPRECGEVLGRSFVVDSAPLLGVTSALNIKMAEVAGKRGITSIMSGSGGDELFNGDLGLFGRMAASRHFPWALYAAATLKGWGRSTVRSRLRALIAGPIARSFLPDFRRKRSLSGWAGPLLRDIEASDVFEAWGTSLGFSGPDRLEVMARSAEFMDYSDTRAQLELAGGCERIDPYLDVDLAGLLSAIDPALLFRGGFVRGLFREVMSDAVPDTLRLRRDKANFETALHELVVAAGGFRVLHPLADVTALADLGLVEPRAFRKTFDALANHPDDGSLWVEVWPVLAAEAFVQGANART
jgi:asparagine synthetase B (glutamine-hydrolysing)